MQDLDTDFHPLDPTTRKEGLKNAAASPVYIMKNAFIGGGTIILKGVMIGENAVIGAGSVVATNVPDGEIWAGNPARKIGTTSKEK